MYPDPPFPQESGMKFSQTGALLRESKKFPCVVVLFLCIFVFGSYKPVRGYRDTSWNFYSLSSDVRLTINDSYLLSVQD